MKLFKKPVVVKPAVHDCMQGDVTLDTVTDTSQTIISRAMDFFLTLTIDHGSIDEDSRRGTHD